MDSNEDVPGSEKKLEITNEHWCRKVREVQFKPCNEVSGKSAKVRSWSMCCHDYRAERCEGQGEMLKGGEQRKQSCQKVLPFPIKTKSDFLNRRLKNPSKSVSCQHQSNVLLMSNICMLFFNMYYSSSSLLGWIGKNCIFSIKRDRK